MIYGPDIMGYIAAMLVFATFWTRTMIPLRTLGIASNVFFILYGFLAAAYPPLILHLFLLPLNIVRLRGMVKLNRQVGHAARSDLNMDWVKPYMAPFRAKAGDIIFRKGETADRMFIIVSGRFRLAESGMEIPSGAMVGELGLFAPGGTRTQTLECVAGGQALQLSYDQFKQLYFQNPSFGFYFLTLVTRRLFENLARAEEELARRPPVAANTNLTRAKTQDNTIAACARA